MSAMYSLYLLFPTVGWFRIQMGNNCLGIEGNVAWATPKVNW